MDQWPSMEMAKTLWRRHSFHLDWLKPHKFETFPEAFQKQICLMQRCRHHLSAANRYGLYLDEPDKVLMELCTLCILLHLKSWESHIEHLKTSNFTIGIWDFYGLHDFPHR